jgi:restriction system protein
MQAERSMFVAMGRYTADAQQFAAQAGMTLVDGEELLRIMGAGLDGVPFEMPVATDPVVPPCPACGATMVQRTAHCGAHADRAFWGCSTVPACRATRELDAAVAGAR